MLRGISGLRSLVARIGGAAVVAVGLAAAGPAVAGDFGWMKRDDGPKRNHRHDDDDRRWRDGHRYHHHHHHHNHGKHHAYGHHKHDHSRWGHDHSRWHHNHPTHSYHPAYRSPPPQSYGFVPPRRPNPPGYYYNWH